MIKLRTNSGFPIPIMMLVGSWTTLGEADTQRILMLAHILKYNHYDTTIINHSQINHKVLYYSQFLVYGVIVHSIVRIILHDSWIPILFHIARLFHSCFILCSVLGTHGISLMTSKISLHYVCSKIRSIKQVHLCYTLPLCP